MRTKPELPLFDGVTSTVAHVAVVDPDEAVRRVVAERLQVGAMTVEAYEQVRSVVRTGERTEPLVVVVGPSMPVEQVFEEVADRLGAWPSPHGVVLIVYEPSAAVLRQAMRAGIDDVVDVSADDIELLDAVQRTADRVVARIHLSETLAPPPPPPPPPPSGVPPGPSSGRLVTVFSTKGGAGKSVLASNLAVALARRGDTAAGPGSADRAKPVVLLDADLQFGDIALMLHLDPVHTIVEAVQAGDRLDAALMRSLLLRHPDSGLSVLAAPTEPAFADQISRVDLMRVVDVLRTMSSIVVVDTSATFGDLTLALLQAADDVLLVAGLDVTSLKNVRLGLQTMGVLGVPFSRMRFVLNRANTKVGLSVGEAERLLELKADVALPSDILVPQSVNRGVPAVLLGPRSKFARSIENLASVLLAAPVQARP